MYDVMISSMSTDPSISGTFIYAAVSNWKINNYTHEITLIVNSIADRNTLRNMIQPQATDNFSNVSGYPVFIDISTDSKDTIKIIPLDVDNSNISSLRSSETLGIAEYQDNILTYDGHFLITLRGYPIT